MRGFRYWETLAPSPPQARQSSEGRRAYHREWKRKRRAPGGAGLPSDTNRRRASRATGKAIAIRATAKAKRIERLKTQLARIELSMLTSLQKMRIRNGHGPDSPLPFIGSAAPRLTYCPLTTKPDPEARRRKAERHAEFSRISYYQSRGITVVRLPWDGPCGVCRRPIDLNEKHPGGGYHNPRARSLGHEPPRSTLRDGGIVYLRPEHWRCNWLKSDLTDEELGLVG